MIQLQLKASNHTEKARANAADCPEQIRVLRSTRGYLLAARQDDIRTDDRIACRAMSSVLACRVKAASKKIAPEGDGMTLRDRENKTVL